MRPLYIVGTQRDVGKTTLAIGLLYSFRQKGLKVAYTKPLGQRVATVGGHVLHDDAMLVSKFLGASDSPQAEMAVPLPSGRVEKEIYDLDTAALLKKVQDAYAILAADRDVVIIESMGHVAMGSCLGLSSAEIARSLNARALLVSGGGIGRAIDEISLCAVFLKARGADLMGAVVNKVWPEKFTRIKDATTQGLKNLGIRSFGTVPFEEELSCPTVRQVHGLLGGELVSGAGKLDNYVEHTIVAAMEASHMVRYLERSTLVITPGDRSDNILAALSTHILGDRQNPAVAGLVLTGGFRPDGTVMKLITDADLPVILVKEDTYAAASKFRQTVFKITPDDDEKIGAAVCTITEYVDTDGILEALRH